MKCTVSNTTLHHEAVPHEVIIEGDEPFMTCNMQQKLAGAEAMHACSVMQIRQHRVGNGDLEPALYVCTPPSRKRMHEHVACDSWWLLMVQLAGDSKYYKC